MQTQAPSNAHIIYKPPIKKGGQLGPLVLYTALTLNYYYAAIAASAESCKANLLSAVANTNVGTPLTKVE